MIPNFDRNSDILVFALPEDPLGGIDHKIRFRRDAARKFLEVALTHSASGARFLVRLPGLKRLDPSAIAVLSLTDADHLPPAPSAKDRAALAGKDTVASDMARKASGPQRMAFVHRHNWYRSGPPPERFFDLSDPASELDMRLDAETGGPIYAIRLTERTTKGEKSASETQRWIILAQTAPGTPHLTSGLLTQWFGTRLGGSDFRVIARIWLGSEGHDTDPETGQTRLVGKINKDPALAIHGQLAGSVAIDR